MANGIFRLLLLVTFIALFKNVQNVQFENVEPNSVWDPMFIRRAAYSPWNNLQRSKRAGREKPEEDYSANADVLVVIQRSGMSVSRKF